MTDEQIIEAMAQAAYETEYADADPWKDLNQDEKLSYVVLARAALAAARPLIREQALREAAVVAKEFEALHECDVSAAILALIPKEPPHA